MISYKKYFVAVGIAILLAAVYSFLSRFFLDYLPRDKYSQILLTLSCPFFSGFFITFYLREKRFSIVGFLSNCMVVFVALLLYVSENMKIPFEATALAIAGLFILTFAGYTVSWFLIKRLAKN